jgi:hypothetical protein
MPQLSKLLLASAVLLAACAKGPDAPKAAAPAANALLISAEDLVTVEEQLAHLRPVDHGLDPARAPCRPARRDPGGRASGPEGKR